MVLKNMKHNRLAMPPCAQERWNPMAKNLIVYCRYHKTRGHHTDNYHILKRDIEALIQQWYLKNFITFIR